MKKTEILLEFNVIKDKLALHALSQEAKQALLNLSPYSKIAVCRAKMAETTAARRILDAMGSPPLSAMTQMRRIIDECEKGSMLLPEQLEFVASFLFSCERLRTYLKKAEDIGEAVGSYGRSIEDLSGLRHDIGNAIRDGIVDDGASPALQDIRRKLENKGLSVKAKLDALLRSKRQCFSDGFIATRNGRYVLPVKREYRSQIAGSVVETSSTGSTYFIEPASVAKLCGEIENLRTEEQNEIRRILYTLTAAVDDRRTPIKRNMEAMEILDVIFAKAKFSAEIGGQPAQITPERRIELRQARHPLIDKSRCVPLDFTLGGQVRGVCITGPNTGGKTVALKTAGLASLMAQCGLHIPAGEGCILAMADNLLCDIGDGQSISENLSTFSAHMSRMIDILSHAGPDSIVLLDELGSGTDPAEGMGIAAAVLEELRRRGCLFMATTHYPEIKEYAHNAPGVVNARMAFDRESLRPLYRLEMGEAGESCALYIAQRLGFPESLLERAKRAAAGSPIIDARLPDLPAPVNPEADPAPQPAKSAPFQMGDSVWVYPGKENGIVYRPADERGEMIVQIKGSKRRVSHKRVKLHVPACELYPPDYDFSILFDTVENRKARRQMEKKHRPDLSVTQESF